MDPSKWIQEAGTLLLLGLVLHVLWKASPQAQQTQTQQQQSQPQVKSSKPPPPPGRAVSPWDP